MIDGIMNDFRMGWFVLDNTRQNCTEVVAGQVTELRDKNVRMLFQLERIID